MFKKIYHNIYFRSFFLGSIAVLSLAPFNIFFALIISLTGFFLLLETVINSAKKSFWLGFSYGFGYFVFGLYWISISLLVDFAKFFWLIPFAITLIPACLSVYFGVTTLLYQKICNKFQFNFVYQKITLLTILFVIFEILRCHLFTGFSWNLFGYSMMFLDYSMQSANIFGIFGLSFFAILFALSPTLLLEKKEANFVNKLFFIALLMLFIINIFYGYFYISENKLNITSNKVRIVQANIKQDLKWDPYLKYQNFKKHIDISNFDNKQDIKAIIWPETAVPYAIGIDDNLDSELQNFVTQNQILISGALRIKKNENNQISDYYNSVFAISDSAIKFYDKHHLVPFGEYVPLQKYLPFIEKITGSGQGFSSGNGPQTIELNNIKFSPLICYEAIFADKIIDHHNRPDLLVNLTNDAWFRDSLGPYQHFAMTKMRAIEYGISLIRAANSGISAYIDPFGRTVKKINLGQAGFIDVELIEKLPETLFSKIGYFAIFFIIIFFLIFLTLDITIIKTKFKKNEKLQKI